MPPRAKKPAVTKAPKRTVRASKPAAAASKPVADSGEVKAVELKEEVKVAVEKSGNDRGSSDLNAGQKSEANESVDLKKEDEVKEDEYEKEDRLDLEDNEPEYEPEEYGGDYDEKEVGKEELEEEGDEGEEGEEEDEEEGDMGEEEDPEELEGEEGNGHAHAGEDHEDDHEHDNDHADLVDSAEEQEHHDHVKERRKRKEFEVFVGGLDKDATEEDLKEVFKAVGEITEVRLMKNSQTKKNKGFAFLRFSTVEQAKRAVTELKNPVVKGKQCGVTPSQDNDTLFLGNICKTWTKEKLKEKLKDYGIDNVEDLTLVEDSNTEGKNRGFAFLEFSSRSNAMDAFKRLQKRDVLLGVERPAKVSFADSFVDPGDEIMAQVKTVFIDGLPASWDEDRVRELLKKYGEIEKVELARNMTYARRMDFGFVSFDSHDAAVSCAKGINNAELGEGDHKAKVRARLSRPSQRGKGKSHPRGERRGGGASVPGRRLRVPWNRSLPHPRPARGRVAAGSRIPPAQNRSFKRPIGVRDRRPLPPPIPARPRPLPPPPRSYERRAPALPPPKSSSLKRGYHRREELPPRSSRAVAEYPSRLPPQRRPSYSHRDEYVARAPAYSDAPRSSASRSAPRRSYADDSYTPRYERPLPSYREGRPRDYDSVSASKRPYSAMEDVPSRYSDSSHGVRHSRARLDYDMPAGASQYGESYSDRLGRPSVGYASGSGSRSSLSAAHDSHGLYSSRQGTSYNGSYGSSDVGGGGVYPSSYGGEHTSRGSDVGGSSYSSLYSSRGMGSSSYMGGASSGSYY